MEIHKPKPINSWRELLTEIGVVVIGVCIALAAEQTVEWLHWQHRVEGARAAMLLELRDDDGPQAFTRAAAVNCFDRQLDEIRAAIEAGRIRANIATLISRYAPPLRTWDSNAWDSMLASDVASHVAPDQMSQWGIVYVVLPRANVAAEQEREYLVALRPTRESGDKLSSNEADTMLAAVARLRAVNRYLSADSGFLLWAMERSGIAMTKKQKSRILDGLRTLYPNCVVVPSSAGVDHTDELSSMRSALGIGLK